MNCKEVKSLLEAFHDKNINLELKRSIKEHLISCSCCKRQLDCLQNLSKLLHESSIPAASSASDKKLMMAFRQKHINSPKPVLWWQKIFTGSINIPRPVFALALILIFAAVMTANLIGRNSAILSDANKLKAISSLMRAPENVSIPAANLEVVKIIEVPVVKEHIVTKVVYVEQQKISSSKKQTKPTGSAQTITSNNVKFNNVKQKLVAPGLEMRDVLAENGYFTRTDLTNLQPASEPKIRIIREEKTNEK